MRIGILAFASTALAAPALTAQFAFAPAPSQPIVPLGPPGAFDAGNAIVARVVRHAGVDHLFYVGDTSLHVDGAIGLATSADGVNFTKHVANPILSADGTGYDAGQLFYCAPLFDASAQQWVLYYGGAPALGTLNGCAVGRAIAPSATGPWVRSAAPVLSPGGPAEWDAGWVAPDTVSKSGSEWRMYYSGGRSFHDLFGAQRRIGLATSVDGVTWTKHDDASTGAPPFAQSDPVLDVGPPGSWDSHFTLLPVVHETEHGFEMFYTGWNGGSGFVSIGYATSADGVAWNRVCAEPAFSGDAAVPVLVSGSIAREGETYVLLYDVNQQTPAPTEIWRAVSATSFRAHGVGCPGAGGFVPQVHLRGCARPGESVTLEIEDGLGGAPAALLLGSGAGQVPAGGGCDLLVASVFPVPILLVLPGAGPGGGGFALTALLPASLPPVSVTLQLFVADAAAAIGLSASNGATLVVP